ncbi:MAG: prolyl oligopeptidase family serine peptidase, partial [Candidatus Thorarchaeota archaeon]
ETLLALREYHIFMHSNPIDIKNYLSIETTGGASWHPDTNTSELAYTSNASGTFQVYTVGAIGIRPYNPVQHTDKVDRCTNPRYLSDGTILFTRDRGGDENFQFGLLSERKVHWVTTILDVKFILNKITRDYIYYSANELDKSRFDIYRRKIPLLENSPELLFKPTSGFTTVAIVSDDDSKIVVQRYLGNVEQEIFVLSIDNAEITELTQPLPESTSTRWEPVRYIDDEHILVITDYKSDFMRFGVLTTYGKFLPLDELDNKLNCSIEYTTYGKQTPYTFFTTNDEGYSSLYRGIFTPLGCFSLELLEMKFKGTLTSGDARSFSQALSVSPDGSHLAFTVSSPTNPTSIWIYDIEKMGMWQTLATHFEGIATGAFTDCTLVRISSFDNVSVPYYRYIPKGERPASGWPAVFIIHGGPEAQIRPEFNPIIQAFLVSGYAVIAPNIRGSKGYGKKYLDLDNVEKRLDSIRDIKQIALHIKKNDVDIDGEKLIIYGVSYGGFAVLSAITEYPELWIAAIDIVGISNFVTFLQNTADWRRPLRESEYGSLETDFDLLTEISPIHKVDKIECPLFIIQGDNDERVPLSESIQMYERVKEKGIPVQLMRFADEGHGLAKLKNRIKAYSEVFKWLAEIV